MPRIRLQIVSAYGNKLSAMRRVCQQIVSPAEHKLIVFNALLAHAEHMLIVLNALLAHAEHKLIAFNALLAHAEHKLIVFSALLAHAIVSVCGTCRNNLSAYSSQPILRSISTNLLWVGATYIFSESAYNSKLAQITQC
jgi:hypothetical protein